MVPDKLEKESLDLGREFGFPVEFDGHRADPIRLRVNVL